MDNFDFEKWRITYIEQQKKDRLILKLDHEKAMQKARLDHETEVYKYKLEIEKIRIENAPKSYQKSTESQKKTFSDEDIEFNTETLFGEGKECNIGKLAKTPAYTASKNLSEILNRDFFQNSTYSKYKSDLDKEDLKKNRIKTLIQSTLWAHSISIRAAKWPDAPDMDLLPKAKDEILVKLSRYSGKAISIVLRFLKEIWDSKISSTTTLDTTLVGEYIDEVCGSYKQQASIMDEVRMENSPFVKVMVQKALEIDPDFKAEALINYCKQIKLKDTWGRKKSDHITFWLAYRYYKPIIHPWYKDTHDAVRWAKDGLQIESELRDRLRGEFDPLEPQVQEEYIKFENLRRERGVLDKIW